MAGRARAGAGAGARAAPAAPAPLARPRRRLGGLEVSEVCLGTMTFGQQNTEAEGHRQLDAAFERGVNFLDTAEIYPVKPAPETQGRTSEIVGSWLKSRPRDDVVLATKVAGRSTGLAWVPANRTVPRGAEATPVLDAASVRAGLEGELRRLRTDYVDLFQLHWPDRPVPAFGRNRYRRADAAPAPGAPPFASFEELVGEIGKLIAEGKVREWGLSNESTFGVCQHVATCDRLGVRRPVTIQNSFSLLHRSFEGELAEACHFFGLGLLPWSALAGGAISGKYTAGTPPNSRFDLFPGRYDRFDPAKNPRVYAAMDKYLAIAKAAGMTGAQLGYAFCRAREFIPSTIIGATSIEQLHENLDAFASPALLGDDVLERIDAVHLEHRDPSLTD